MTGRRRPIRSLCLGLLLALLFRGNVLAAGDALPCLLTGEDVGNGYEYTVAGIGSFTVNGKEGETLNAAVFSADEGCRMVFYQDGVRFDAGDGMILDPGEYEMQLYPASDPQQQGDYGSFRFTIENEYADILERVDPEDMNIVDHPELRLTIADGWFCYTLPNGRYVRLNVPIGGWTRNPVTVTASEGLNLYLVRLDGEPFDFTGGLRFGQAGSYELLFRDNELGLEGDTSYRLTVSFTLYLPKTMDLSHINTPHGLMLSAAYRDGSLVYPAGGAETGVTRGGEDFIHLEADGSWLLEFADSGGQTQWEMEFLRDTKAPFLKFSQKADGKVLSEAVSYMPSELTAQIRIYRNGEEVSASRNQIAVNGVYHIEVEDGAGNVRDYDFSLGTRYEFEYRSWIIILAVLLLLVFASLLYWRRNIQVL